MPDSEKSELLTSKKSSPSNPSDFLLPNDQKKIFQNICELFESQALASSDNDALIFKGLRLKYKDLHREALALSLYLRSKGVGPGVVVGLRLNVDESLIIAILGILRSGGTYLPLDPNYPEERLKYMMDDAKPSFLVTKSDIRIPPLNGCTPIFLDSNWKKIGIENPENHPNSCIEPQHPAYIVYTSGSTGQPKGIEVCHESLPNVILSRTHIYPKKPKVLLVGSISFDPTLLTILYALVSGGSLFLPSEDSFNDPKKLIEFIIGESIDFILCVTSFYSLLLECTEKIPTLKYVFLGGENMPSSLPVLHSQVASQSYLYNEYGPAEHAIGGTIAKIYDPKSKIINPITIGKPLPNVEILILDENRNLVPEGCEGEIYIGGIGLAKRYINRPDLTYEKFIILSIPGGNPHRFYRTGDRGRLLGSGDIEFLGRIDHQVKILGHRVEPGEIEHILGQYPDVVDTIVVVEKKESIRLVAFFSTAKQIDIKEDLRGFLARFLPQYMIPSLFIQIEKWPTTPNGKIDREALLSIINVCSHNNVKEPCCIEELEQNLFKIWQQILQIPDIGLNENFFDLGGSSLQIFCLQSLIEEKMNISVSAIDLFEYPTLSQLAKHLQSKLNAEAEKFLVPDSDEILI